MSTTLKASYDEAPYRSYAFPQTHPDRLALIGWLFGMTPPPIERCRVLELGCASGGNLIPMAATLPGGEFVGIDFSPVQVREGRRDAEALGLSNLRLLDLDIRAADATLGTFDYIVAHGVYSWVPDEVRDRLLALCASLLAPSGIAYVSYNTLPGWGMRGVVRTAMRHHTRQFADPSTRVQQARAMLDFLAESLAASPAPYATMLRAEAEWVRRQPDFYLLHDHLEEVNDPVYFFEFAEHVARHRLRYLGDADFKTMLAGDFPPSVGQTLARIAPDTLKREQLLDFLRNRMFRQTLLVHEGIAPVRKLSPERITRLYAASAATPVRPPAGLDTHERVEYRAPDGAITVTGAPIAKAAMTVLADAWPDCLAFDELLARATERLAPAAASGDARGMLASHLMHCFAAGIVELRLRPAAFVITPGARPHSSAFAILQAARGPSVTNLRHEPVALDAEARRVLALCNGMRTRAEIASAAWPADPEQTRAARLAALLDGLARQALLMREA